MAEYIEREAFIAEQRYLYCVNCERRKGIKNGKMKFVYTIGEAPCRACGIGDMLDAIEDAPAADVAPVRHGRWVWDGGEDMHYYCSLCHHNAYGNTAEIIDGKYNYCPNCGALMDKDGDGDV